MKKPLFQFPDLPKLVLLINQRPPSPTPIILITLQNSEGDVEGGGEGRARKHFLGFFLRNGKKKLLLKSDVFLPSKQGTSAVSRLLRPSVNLNFPSISSGTSPAHVCVAHAGARLPLDQDSRDPPPSAWHAVSGETLHQHSNTPPSLTKKGKKRNFNLPAISNGNLQSGEILRKWALQ